MEIRPTNFSSIYMNTISTSSGLVCQQAKSSAGEICVLAARPWRTNAFSISWKNLQAYTFPPFNLITLKYYRRLTEKNVHYF
jgi:hypothetical protein